MTPATEERGANSYFSCHHNAYVQILSYLDKFALQFKDEVTLK